MLVLEVLACAVCRTDLQICEGDLAARTLPIVPGHQVVGRVEVMGPGVAGFRKGDRVGVGWLAGTCGVCDKCRSGRENLCEKARFTGWDEPGAMRRASWCGPISLYACRSGSTIKRPHRCFAGGSSATARSFAPAYDPAGGWGSTDSARPRASRSRWLATGDAASSSAPARGPSRRTRSLWAPSGRGCGHDPRCRSMRRLPLRPRRTWFALRSRPPIAAERWPSTPFTSIGFRRSRTRSCGGSGVSSALPTSPDVMPRNF